MREFNIDYHGIPLTVTANIIETKDHLGTGDSATEIISEPVEIDGKHFARYRLQNPFTTL